MKPLKASLMISQHWFRYWLGAVRQQAITWTNVDTDFCRLMSSPGRNELTNYSRAGQVHEPILTQIYVVQWRHYRPQWVNPHCENSTFMIPIVKATPCEHLTLLLHNIWMNCSPQDIEIYVHLTHVTDCSIYCKLTMSLAVIEQQLHSYIQTLFSKFMTLPWVKSHFF